jgi:hypothetical protein
MAVLSHSGTAWRQDIPMTWEPWDIDGTILAGAKESGQVAYIIDFQYILRFFWPPGIATEEEDSY